MQNGKSTILRTLGWVYLLLCALCLALPACAAEVNCTEKWEHYETYNNSMGEGSEHTLTKPYTTVYFLSDGTAYSTDGLLYSYSAGSNSYSTADGRVFFIDQSGDTGYSSVAWEGGSADYHYYRTVYNPTGMDSFRASVSVSAAALTVGEEVTVHVSATGGTGVCTYDINVFKESGNCIKKYLDQGTPNLLFFDEAGTYRVYATAVDENGNRSMCGMCTVTVTGSAGETTAEISTLESLHTRTAEGDELEWKLQATGGEGELTQIAYLFRDEEYIGRYEFDGLQGSALAEERGEYRVLVRLKDSASNAYSPFFSRYITVWPLYSYTVLTGEDGTESIRLDTLNSHLPAAEIPAVFDGYPVTEASRGIFYYACDLLTSLTWTPAVAEIPALSYRMTALETLILPEGVTGIADAPAGSNGAFENADKLTDVSLPASLRQIGAKAFANCDELASVTLGNGTETIGDSAFADCTALSEITFGESLKAIGSYAFSGTAFTSLVLPDGVETIGSHAFNMDTLSRLELPDTVTALNNSAFYGLSDTLTCLRWPGGVKNVPAGTFVNFDVLETLVLGEGVTAIGETAGSWGAFEGCDALVNITLPDTLVTIGEKAFANCTALVSLTLGRDLQTIGDSAFEGCASLSGLTFGESLKTLGASALEGTAFTSLSLPEGVESIGGAAFNTNTLTRLELPDTVNSLDTQAFYALSDTLTYLRWPGGVAVVPAGRLSNYDKLETVVIGEGVTELAAAPSEAAGVFSGCALLAEVQLPSTLTLIGDYAFNDCPMLAAITLGDRLVSIGRSAFSDCVALDAVTLGSGVETVGHYAFSGCTSLETFTVNEALKTLGDCALKDCPLTSLALPEGMTAIGSRPFDGTLLTCIALPDSVTTVGTKPFGGLESILECVRWSAGMPVVPGGMFSGFSALETVILPEGVTEIGPGTSSSNGAFSACKALTDVQLPSTLTTIGDYAFAGCAALTALKLDEGLETIGKYAFSNTGLTCLELPDSVTAMDATALSGLAARLTGIRWSAGIPEIPASMFYNFSVLETVILPEGVTEIGPGTSSSSGAFSACKALMDVQLPASLTQIGDYAFNGCTQLATVRMGDLVETIGSHAFDGCTALDTLTLSAGLKQLGDYALRKCPLTTLELPSGLTAIGKYALSNTGLTRLELPDSVTAMDATALNGLAATLTYVKWTAGIPVVPAGMFYNFSVLETAVLPEGVTALLSDATGNGRGVFAGCKALMDVQLPASLTQIGDYAFKGCTQLATVRMGDLVETIGSYAFDGCTALDTLTLSAGLKQLGDYALRKCPLTTLELPSGLTAIGKYALSNTGLTRLELPDSVTAIEDRAFNDLTATLTYVKWTAGIPVVPAGMFYNMSRLETVVLPEGVTEIAAGTSVYNGAFGSCSALAEVQLPSTLNRIGDYAFEGASALKLVYMPCGISTVGSKCFPAAASLVCALECPTATALASAGLTVTAPAAGVLTLPAGIVQVEEEAFAGSAAGLLVVPEGCAAIGSRAFAGMEGLLYIQLPSTVADIAPDAFAGCDPLCVVVTAGSAAEDFCRTAGLTNCPR